MPKAVYRAREDGDWDFVAAFADDNEDDDSNMTLVDSFVTDVENEGDEVKVISGELKDFPDVLTTDGVSEPMVHVVVLNDGETYTLREGCRVVSIPQSDWERSVSDQEEAMLVKERYVTGVQVR